MQRLLLLWLYFGLLWCTSLVSVAESNSKGGSRDHYRWYTRDGEDIQKDLLRQYTRHIPWIKWNQLVHSVTRAQCTLLKGSSSYYSIGQDVKTHTVGEDAVWHFLATSRSASSNKMCHLPIMLLFHQNGCPACQELLDDVGKSAEFELLSEYMTLVSAKTLDDTIRHYPYPQPRIGGNFSFRRRDRKRKELKKGKANVMRETFAGQGEYFPRVFFLFPHNGSVMPIFNQGMNIDPSYLHFYHDAPSLVRSMMSALRMMNEAVDFSEL
ncbi:hypothetical protein DQ04_07261010 [Trypanosoma grayi]|uniref:hypothetical protein n=1 Tax=Trypanosoma grayi TaxID=71804 RepID=UPI0004F46142|nr:hypothetical protein DQ04_07261010 [Trypanosoma grayi]KEG08406.1 hypothetical protein DQ04_07261010 [Trypanosoma grayi]